MASRRSISLMRMFSTLRIFVGPVSERRDGGERHHRVEEM